MNPKEKAAYDSVVVRALQVGVPEHLVSGLALYLVKGIEPGGFMMAVLENDLMGAFSRADINSRAGMFELVQFLYNDTPRNCHGSREAVMAWMKQGGEGESYVNR
jgi:hypothetical protein